MLSYGKRAIFHGSTAGLTIMIRQADYYYTAMVPGHIRIALVTRTFVQADVDYRIILRFLYIREHQWALPWRPILNLQALPAFCA